MTNYIILKTVCNVITCKGGPRMSLASPSCLLKPWKCLIFDSWFDLEISTFDVRFIHETCFIITWLIFYTILVKLVHDIKVWDCDFDDWPMHPRKQSSWGQHGAHLGPVSPRWAPSWSHKPCYQGGLTLVLTLRHTVASYITPCYHNS